MVCIYHRAVFASGSPFEDVTDESGNVIMRCNQSNNFYIFPGVGLGAQVRIGKAIQVGSRKAKRGQAWWYGFVCDSSRRCKQGMPCKADKTLNLIVGLDAKLLHLLCVLLGALVVEDTPTRDTE